jgi:hypothetical protein
MDGTSMEMVFYCNREFQEVCDKLNFDTGPELYLTFCRILRGAAKDDWDIVISNQPLQTPASFLTA